MTETLLVIDGNSILNRAFYGIKLLTNREGLFTNAVYGMITIISKHVEKIKPDYCAVAFDLKAPTFRHEMYDGYKATRKGMPEELAVQLPYAKECMEALGYSVISKEGFEADDLLGTLCAEAKRNNIRSYVLTGDRDSLQLIDDLVSVLLVKTKETITYTPTLFKETYGIEPSQFVDVKALMGDSSDNIPGVAGIGEKTALKLISDFGDIDSLYNKYETSSLTASVKNKISEGKEKAYLSRVLSEIKCDVPLSDSFNEYKYRGIDKEKLLKLFLKLDFTALIQKFGLEKTTRVDVLEKSNEKNQEVLLLTGKEIPNTLGEQIIFVDINGENINIFDGKYMYTLHLNDDLRALSSAVSSCRIVCYDYKRLAKVFKMKSSVLPQCTFDIMLAAYVLDPIMGKFELNDICEKYGLDHVSDNASRLLAIKSLYDILSIKIQEEKLEKILYEIEQPLASVLADMEIEGFKIDINGILNYSEELKLFAEDLQTRIYSYAGEEFNIASPKQLGEILFEKMGLPKSKKTKTGYSTDAETLQKMINTHPIVEDILEYRQVTKLKSTYADGLSKAIDENERVHSIFSQVVTATGRLSSSEPNLQNIPIKTEAGRKFRKYFIPKNHDYVLIDADYSQIELRILAHVSKDSSMINSFLRGEDIHTATASRVFGVSAENITLELRKRAKAVNFGIIYGMGEYSLAEDLGISRTQAKQYIESYFEKFPQIYEYLQNVKKLAEENGCVYTEFGRKRPIPEIMSSNKNLKHFGERVAMNSPIQGAAADIMKIAMIKVSEQLKESGIDAKLILQVHDELLLEANRNCADEAMAILVNSMEHAVELSVPLSVDAHIGENWYEAK